MVLQLTDVCIKNGGDHFLSEIASRDFIDNLVSILKMPGLNMDVKNKILRYIQNWALAFEGKPALQYVPQVYRDLKSEGAYLRHAVHSQPDLCLSRLQFPSEGSLCD